MPRLPRNPSGRLFSRGAVVVCVAVVMAASTARAATTAYQPAAPQPTLPANGGAKPTSPVVDSLVTNDALVVHVRKAAEHPRRQKLRARRHYARPHATPPIQRPALAGVELLQPLPRPAEPPHIVVPLPAYALDPVLLPITMPPPPLVCHPVRRDPDLPDPRLYRERAVVCEADNP